MQEIIIEIPFKTPTINHIYFNWQNRRILTKEARNLKIEIARIIKKQNPDTFGLKTNKLNLEVEIHENWYTKKGKVACKDISNREKFLIDSVFKALRIDDKFIFNHTMKKIESETEKSIIKIEPIEKEVI